MTSAGARRHAHVVIPDLVRQHAEDSATLYAARTLAARSRVTGLSHLRTIDDRLDAHLDALVIAGEPAVRFCAAALEVPSGDRVFPAAVLALRLGDRQRLNHLLAMVEAVPLASDGLIAALGWVDPRHLRGVVATLLESQSPTRRIFGIAACAAHNVDPGLLSRRLIEDPDAGVRARALRAVPELGKGDLLIACRAALSAGQPEVAFWSAHAATLLGDGGDATRRLLQFTVDGAYARAARSLALQVLPLQEAHSLLQRLAIDPQNGRTVVEGAGVVGDSRYVPWLISKMREDAVARLAGWAFSLMTGLDLRSSRLDRERPTDFEGGPNADPDDVDVRMDEDEGLPWPDAVRVAGWWEMNRDTFPAGTRWFLGKRLTRQHCVHVLKAGSQCHRILAAHYLCLLEPGTPLFNASAPSRRQQHLLARMS